VSQSVEAAEPVGLPELTTLLDSPPDLQRELVLAKEGERRRWARNLHDETLQGLAMLRVALTRLANSESVDRTALDTAVSDLDEQIESLRRLVDGLRPTLLDQLGLGPALTALIERERRGSSTRVDVRLALGDGHERLRPDVELAAYRLLQEALHNAIQHAQARAVRLAVGRRRHCLAVLVTDDGCGFDIDATVHGGGLPGMGEWASLAGGTVEIRSRVGLGTTVEAELPLER